MENDICYAITQFVIYNRLAGEKCIIFCLSIGMKLW